MAEQTTRPAPLFSSSEHKQRPIFGTSNIVPVVGLAISTLAVFWSFATAQTKQETGLTAVQSEVRRVEVMGNKDLQKVEIAQQQLKVDIKEELREVNKKVDSLQQILVQIQLQLVELKQGQKK